VSRCATNARGAPTGYDVVVVGGGIAGLVAALAAAEQGAQVAVLESSARVGGTWGTLVSCLSGPRRSGEAESESGADGLEEDSARSRLLAAVAWLGGRGLRFTEGIGAQDAAPCFAPNGPAVELTSRLLSGIEGVRGAVMPATRGLALRMDGMAVRAVVASSRGARTEMRCRAAILCTGGFGANPEMLTRYVGTWGDRLVPRGAPGAIGDGLRMGLEAGAAASRGLARVHGHPVPAVPPRLGPDVERRPDVGRDSTIRSHFGGIVVDQLGARFVDESVSPVNTNQELAFRREAKGFLITTLSRRAGVGTDRCDVPELTSIVEAAGGELAVAGSLQDVAEALHAWGAHGRGAIETVLEYNTAVRNGTAAALEIPRRGDARVLEEPPFVVVPVSASVIWTSGGLLTDEVSRVLDRDGEAIEGLYAAGTDAGNAPENDFGGGAWAVVSGRIAGMTAGATAGTRGVRSS
jgi:succinate dehydrogenase/fumarate reductase flavoprotein subunit